MHTRVPLVPARDHDHVHVLGQGIVELLGEEVAVLGGTQGEAEIPLGVVGVVPLQVAAAAAGVGVDTHGHRDLLGLALEIRTESLGRLLEPVPVAHVLLVGTRLPCPALADGEGLVDQGLVGIGVEGVQLGIILQLLTIILAGLGRSGGDRPRPLVGGVLVAQHQRLALPLEEEILVVGVIVEGLQQGVETVEEGEGHITVHEGDLRGLPTLVADGLPGVEEDLALLGVEAVVGHVQEDEVYPCGIQHVGMLAVDPGIVAGVVAEVGLGPVRTVASREGGELGGYVGHTALQIEAGHVVDVAAAHIVGMDHEVEQTYVLILARAHLRKGGGGAVEIVGGHPGGVVHGTARDGLGDDIGVGVGYVIQIPAGTGDLQGGIACTGEVDGGKGLARGSGQGLGHAVPREGVDGLAVHEDGDGGTVIR